jgi:hypothetical protein
MNPIKSSLNPTLKIALMSLDLNLESELLRYVNQTTVSLTLPTAINRSTLKVTTVLESSFTEKKDQHGKIVKVNQETENTNDDPIPVAAKIISFPDSILDSWLTPWGMFSIILFLLANAIIFINWGLEPELSPNQISNQNLAEEDTKSAVKANLASELAKQPENSTSLTSSITPNQSSLSAETIQNNYVPLPKPTQPNLSENSPPPPPLPLPLPNPREYLVSNPSSSYPDLATALLSNLDSGVSKSVNSASQVKQSSTNPSAIIEKVVEERDHKSPYLHESTKISPSKNISEIESFYVVADYQNLDSLTEITLIVPNAFMTNIEDKLKIQLGKFATKAEANQFAQRLQQKGVNSYVYPAVMD